MVLKVTSESDIVAKGLNEAVIKLISEKGEPKWMLEFRLKAFEHWKTLEEPKWSNVDYPKIDFQDIAYYSAPKKKDTKKSMDEVDPELFLHF